MQYNEIILDLETLGIDKDAHIVSIGAVKFNLDGNDDFLNLASASAKDRQFYVELRLDELNGDIDGRTLSWWFQQNAEARKTFLPNSDQVRLPVALLKFNTFVETGQNIWGNGATFDNVIIKDAYNRVGGVEPKWNFRQDLDVRTIQYLALKKVPDLYTDEFKKLGVEHHALSDAIREVLLIQRCYRALNGTLNDSERKPVARLLGSVS